MIPCIFHSLHFHPTQDNSRHDRRLLLLLSDIDVAEPDEKSIVTYVSLLYDTFPNVPSLEQSLRDNVSYVLAYLTDFAHLFAKM